MSTSILIQLPLPLYLFDKLNALDKFNLLNALNALSLLNVRNLLNLLNLLNELSALSPLNASSALSLFSQFNTLSLFDRLNPLNTLNLPDTPNSLNFRQISRCTHHSRHQLISLILVIASPFTAHIIARTIDKGILFTIRALPLSSPNTHIPLHTPPLTFLEFLDLRRMKVVEICVCAFFRLNHHAA